MKLNKVKILFCMLLVSSFSFAIEIEERKEKDLTTLVKNESEKIIIPTQYKELQVSKNYLKILSEKIGHTKAYKLLNKFIIKKGDRLIVQNAKGIMVLGLAGMQMIISKLDVSGPVVYTSHMETGNGIAQYGINKKINPKLLIMALMGMALLIKWLCTFDTYGATITIPSFGPYNVTDSSIISANGTVTDNYNIILNNCLIDLNDLIGLGYYPQPYNYTIPNIDSAMNACLQNLNALINSSDVIPTDPWQFLTDFQNSFLISVYCTGLYILQEMGKSKRTIKSQTDVNCMQIQTDDNLSEEQLDDVNFDNNISGKLTFDGTKKVDSACMTNESYIASTMTTQADTGSSFVTPNVTPEKLKILTNSPKNGLASPSNTFRIISKTRNHSTQAPNQDGKSLSEYADMQTNEEGKELFGRVIDVNNQPINFVLDID